MQTLVRGRSVALVLLFVDKDDMITSVSSAVLPL